jgi:hypothetical protein
LLANQEDFEMAFALMRLVALVAICVSTTAYVRGADQYTAEDVRLLVQKHEGGNLDELSAVEALSDAVAAELGHFKGGYLNLNGLNRLSASGAQELSLARCTLALNGLERLSDSAAEALGQHKGELLLTGLTRLSDEAAQGLSQHRGGLNIRQVKDLSERALIALAQTEGSLDLESLETLSDAAAEALSRQDGGLGGINLKRVTFLSDRAAAALASYRGSYLGLENLTQSCVDRFSDETLAALRANKSIRGWFMNEK